MPVQVQVRSQTALISNWHATWEPFMLLTRDLPVTFHFRGATELVGHMHGESLGVASSVHIWKLHIGRRTKISATIISARVAGSVQAILSKEQRPDSAISQSGPVLMRGIR